MPLEALGVSLSAKRRNGSAIHHAFGRSWQNFLSIWRVSCLIVSLYMAVALWMVWGLEVRPNTKTSRTAVSILALNCPSARMISGNPT